MFRHTYLKTHPTQILIPGSNLHWRKEERKYRILPLFSTHLVTTILYMLKLTGMGFIFKLFYVLLGGGGGRLELGQWGIVMWIKLVFDFLPVQNPPGHHLDLVKVLTTEKKLWSTFLMIANVFIKSYFLWKTEIKLLNH